MKKRMGVTRAAGAYQSRTRGDRLNDSAAVSPLLSLAAITLAFSAACPVFCQPASQSASRLSGKITFNKISAPESGVELLEKIFNRVMSIPQIALSKPAAKEEKSRFPRESSGVDYALAIRPKETGKLSIAQSPSLRVLPPTKLTGFVAPADSLRLANETAAGAPVAGARDVEEEALVENWKGGNLQRVPSKPKEEQSNRPGVWDKDQSARADGAKDLSRAVAAAHEGAYANTGGAQTVFQGRRALREAQPGDAAVTKPDDAPAQFKKGSPTETAMQQRARAGGRALQIMDEPLLSDRREPAFQLESAKVDLKNAREPYSSSAGKRTAAFALPPSPAATPASGAANALPSNAIPAEILSIEATDSTATTRAQSAAAHSRANAIAGQLYSQMLGRSAEKKELIALLPPNVATGIPLVSLGTSQFQVASALSSMGRLKEQRINRWTVMTWKKPGSSDTSLQLFFRNGLLDAIRIFDPTLVAADFGVAPGDQLERVKEKFGEPAFLLQEPAQGPGQNYIYPISQVGFQLARTDSASPPKVVSVLIFSVK